MSDLHTDVNIERTASEEPEASDARCSPLMAENELRAVDDNERPTY